MFAGLGIQAGIRHAKPLDRFAAHDVRFDNFIHIGFGDEPIPHRFGINDEVRSVLALVEAAGLVGPYAALEAALRQFLLEEFLQAAFGGWVAAPARMAHRTLVAADEDMFFEFWHGRRHSRTSSGVSIRFYLLLPQ
jgi:hypothetical protein